MNYENAKLSVIVPIYNAEVFLNRCINSILQQIYQNLEIILVNDGSTDNSLKICQMYKSKDDRVVVINKNNAGVSAARKDALQVATGDFITFVDSDDYIDSNMYKNLMRTMAEGDFDIIESGYTLVDENEEVICVRKLVNEQRMGKSNCLEGYLSNRNSDTFLWNKIYRRTLFDGLDLPEYRYSEDHLWNVLLFSRCNKSITVSSVYYTYYKNMGGACNSNKYWAKLDGIFAGVEALTYLEKNFPQFGYWGVIYILDYARFLYMIDRELQIDEHRLYKELSKYYRRYFNISAVLKSRDKRKFPGYLLFFLSPSIYAYLNRLYHKKKSD